MHRLNLAQANALIEAAFAKGAELGLRPLTVTVHDLGASGVTGDNSDHDEACALAAIAALGLTPKN